MIDGLKVTFTGEELRRLLEARAELHRVAAARWDSERHRTADDATQDASIFPEHICEIEARREKWRANVLTFLRDHLDTSEVYRLDMDDLKSARLLPAKPDWTDEDESARSMDERPDLGPHTTRICDSPEIVLVTNPDAPRR